MIKAFPPWSCTSQATYPSLGSDPSTSDYFILLRDQMRLIHVSLETQDIDVSLRKEMDSIQDNEPDLPEAYNSTPTLNLGRFRRKNEFVPCQNLLGT